jgi:hypothetical protein
MRPNVGRVRNRRGRAGANGIQARKNATGGTAKTAQRPNGAGHGGNHAGHGGTTQGTTELRRARRNYAGPERRTGRVEAH